MTDILGTTGSDVLAGTANDDTLNGLQGADKMSGGGNDLYVVDNAGDKVTGLANQGARAAVFAAISTTLGADIEDLHLFGGALNGTGNKLGNFLVGNMLDNSLLHPNFDNAENLTLLGIGNLNATGSGVPNIIVGNNGNNQLDGGGDGFVTPATLTGVTNVTVNDLLFPQTPPAP